jgi:hypothetical protein
VIRARNARQHGRRRCEVKTSHVFEAERTVMRRLITVAIISLLIAPIAVAQSNDTQVAQKGQTVGSRRSIKANTPIVMTRHIQTCNHQRRLGAESAGGARSTGEHAETYAVYNIAAWRARWRMRGDYVRHLVEEQEVGGGDARH